MHIKFEFVHNNKTLIVHAEIINPEPDVGINERDSYIEEVTTKRGKMYTVSRDTEINMEVAALEKYTELYLNK